MATIFNNINTYSFFLPTDYLNYKYMINCTADYIDLIDTPSIPSNTNYNYIRVYSNKEGFIVERSGNTGYYTTTATPVNVTDSFFARRDCLDICCISFIFIFLLVFIFNILTEFLNKGGIFK